MDADVSTHRLNGSLMKRDIQRRGGWRTTSVANTLLILSFPLRCLLPSCSSAHHLLYVSRLGLLFCPRRKKPVKCDQLVAGCFLPRSRWATSDRRRKGRASLWQKAVKSASILLREEWEKRREKRERRKKGRPSLRKLLSPESINFFNRQQG